MHSPVGLNELKLQCKPLVFYDLTCERVELMPHPENVPFYDDVRCLQEWLSERCKQQHLSGPRDRPVLNGSRTQQHSECVVIRFNTSSILPLEKNSHSAVRGLEVATSESALVSAGDNTAR